MATNAQVLEQLDKAKTNLSRYKARARESGEKVLNTVAVIGGGAVAGVLDGKYADKKLLGMSLGTVVGLVSTGIGIMGVAGSYSDAIGFFGAGVLAVEAYKYAVKKTANGNVSGMIGAERRRRQMGAGSSVTAADIRSRMHVAG